MSLKKHNKYTYPQTVTNYNVTNADNPSHLVDENTNFIFRPITLENIDQCVFEAFNRKFTIASKILNLIPLDAEVASLRFQNPQSFDTGKQFLNFPYFTMWRSATNPLMRISPSNKPVIYSIPKKKAQGVVYEEYIMPPPNYLKLNYTFKFITTYREYLNEMETQFLEYFKNKRGVIIWDNERFEVMPNEQFTLGTLETVEREGSNGASMYVVTYELQVIAYTRDISQIQKREKPNTFTLTLGEASGTSLATITQTDNRLPKPLPET